MVYGDSLGSLMLQIYTITLNVRKEKPHSLTGYSFLSIVSSSDCLPPDWQCLQVQRFWGQRCLPLLAGSVLGRHWT